ncbi:MAG: septal ring lytic transglycosylase RlpA family protein [Hyphomicrobiales bacterium]|nr:MAG: septal ring lytic transglycosylase RlpA family protein [Hyphomicrobiales bacterium]
MIKHIVVAAALVTGCLSFSTGQSFAAGDQCGTASWYGPGFHGKTAASGETYNQNAMTAAHKTLPFGTKLKVTNQKTGKSVTVKINDRGPYHGSRVIDLSKAAASALGIVQAGTGKVCFTRV